MHQRKLVSELLDRAAPAERRRAGLHNVFRQLFYQLPAAADRTGGCPAATGLADWQTGRLANCPVATGLADWQTDSLANCPVATGLADRTGRLADWYTELAPVLQLLDWQTGLASVLQLLLSL